MTRQSVSAHDVANSNTDGFGQYTAYQTDMKPSGTRLSHITRDSEMPSGTDYATEAVEQKESLNNLKANSAVFKVQDRMTGTLLDIFA